MTTEARKAIFFGDRPADLPIPEGFGTLAQNATFKADNEVDVPNQWTPLYLSGGFQSTRSVRVRQQSADSPFELVTPSGAIPVKNHGELNLLVSNRIPTDIKAQPVNKIKPNSAEELLLIAVAVAEDGVKVVLSRGIDHIWLQPGYKTYDHPDAARLTDWEPSRHPDFESLRRNRNLAS